MTKSLRTLLAAVLVTALTAAPAAAYASPVAVNNQMKQNYPQNRLYTSWPDDTVHSHLTSQPDGTLQLVYTPYADNSPIYVETYTAGKDAPAFRSGFSLAAELPLFGGYYRSDRYHFLIFGQNNPSCDPSKEVIRVVKYDLNWDRLGSVSLRGANTTIPFDAGSLRCSHSGNNLYIRTCHEMYSGHQANMTLLVNMETMSISSSMYDVQSYYYGYVSHSFNQFISADSGTLYAVDHGDAHPRSVALFRYSSNSTVRTYTSMVQVLPIQGETGDNATGVSVGGFEVTDSACLIAGNSVVQDSRFASRRTRNVFLSSTDANFSSSSLTWLTQYEEVGLYSASTPQMVKVNDNRFLVLWDRLVNTGTSFTYYQANHTLCWVLVDASGKALTPVYTASGSLSDCKPILWNGKVTWFTGSGTAARFYSIDPSYPAVLQGQESASGQNYLSPGVDSMAALGCYNAAGRMVDLSVTDLSAGQKLYLTQPDSNPHSYHLMLWDKNTLHPLRPMWSPN